MSAKKRDVAAILGGPKYRNPGAPRLPAHPFRGCVAGMSGSGKTQWVVENLILDPQTPFDRFIWVAPKYSLEQDKVKRMEEAFKDPKAKEPLARQRFLTVEGVTSEDSQKRLMKLIDEGHKAGLQQLVVFDDLIAHSKSPLIAEMFTAGRHKNCSTVELVQQCFAPGTRLHRINCDIFVNFTFGDAREAKMLFQQICPNDWKKLAEAYNESTRGKGPGSYFLIDQQAARSIDPDHRILRFRSSSLDNVYPELADAC